MITQPLFIHDSDCDTFLGTAPVVMPRGDNFPYDFYFCRVTGSVIARYGDDGPEYTSFGGLGSYQQSLIDLDPRLAEAHRRAVEAGHIVDGKAILEPTP